MVVGLDSADAGLIERWCDEGHLPILRSLRAQGLWGRIGTTADALHVSGWPSFYTGTTPDKHGLYHAYVMRPGVQAPERPRPDESPEPCFWKLLSDAGRRCVVVDAFMNCPLEPFNGTQVLEYGTWTWFWEPTTRPRELQRELLARFGRYPAEDHGKVLGPPEPAGFRDRLVAGAQTKAELVTWLMQREPWDLFLVVFGEAHPAGHYLWHLHDAEHPAHPAAGAGALGTALRDVYVALDRAIGRIVAGLGPDTTLLVLSGDGMGPNHSGSHLLDEVLKATGLLAIAGERGAAAGPGGAAGGPARSDLVKRLRNLVPGSLRRAVSRHLLPHDVKQRLALRWMTADVVWPRTRAFPISNANEGYVRVNLRGREPEGIVAPGAEYEQVCESLLATARELVNPVTGRPAARAVWRTDAVYRGPRRDRLPDVVVNWDPEARLTTEIFGPACGRLKASAPWEIVPHYTGNHEPAAFLLARGPGLPAGATLRDAHVLDLAPTVLAHLGLDPTPSMDGTVLPQLRGGGR
jgi:predicted AlkP superfamily phosphohydrolase/phosphomutase